MILEQLIFGEGLD